MKTLCVTWKGGYTLINIIRIIEKNGDDDYETEYSENVFLNFFNLFKVISWTSLTIYLHACEC